MLFDWAISVSIVLSIILAVVVATFLLDNLLTFRTNRVASDDPIQEAFENAQLERRMAQKKMYQQIALVYVNQIFNSIISIGSKVFELPGFFTHVITVTWQNRRIIIIGSLLSVFAFGLFENGPLILEKLDGAYSCVITPFVNNILFSILHVTNLLWTSFIPYYNIWVILIRQIFTGTFLIATKCATSSLSLAGLLGDFVEYFITILQETLAFTGISTNNFAEQNMFTNEFIIHTISAKWRKIFQFLPDTLTCFCSATSDFSNLPFYGFITSDHIDWISHHAVNSFISFVQTFVKIIPPYLEYPDFENTFFHTLSAFWEFCELMDEWIFEAVNTILNTTNVDGGILIETPKIFLFESYSHLFSAGTMFLKTAVDVISHILLPFDTPPITNTEFMASLFKLDKMFIHINLFVHSVSHLLTWVVRTLVEMLIAGIYIKRCLILSETVGLAENTCVSFVDGQCSVSCVSSTQIKIHDINITCPFRTDTKNRYNHQKSIFVEIASDASDRIENQNFYSQNKYLPLEDKHIFINLQKQNNYIFSKIYFDNIVLRDSNQYNICLRYGTRSSRKECYKSFIQQQFEEAYGVTAGDSLFSSIGCSIESFLFIPLNSLEISYAFSIDYFWFQVTQTFREDENLNDEQKQQRNGENLRGLLRAYAGPWFGRDYPPPCDVKFNIERFQHFYSIDDYNKYLISNNNKCNRPNLNEHVFFHFDRLGYYLIQNVFEKETLGKFAYNVYRLLIEQFRILSRLDAEGYGLNVGEDRTLFENGKIKFNPSYEADFFDHQIGCLYNYGNITHPKEGSCASPVSGASECNVYDTTLSYDSDCSCIFNPGLHTGNYVQIAEENTRYYTTKAISKWCHLNLWDFNYIFLARALNGLRNFIHVFTPGNNFPPIPNLCDTSQYQYTHTTTISTIFGQTCNVIAYKDFFCPTGDLLQRIFVALSRFLRKQQRNLLYLISGYVHRVDLTILDEVCDAQNALMAVSNMISTLIISQDDVNLQIPFTKLVFSLTNVISLPFEWGALGLRSLRAFLTGDVTILQTGVFSNVGSIDISSISNVVSKTISLFVKTITKHMFEVCDGFIVFLNAIIPCNGNICAGSLFESFKILIQIVEMLLSDVFLPTIIGLLELGLTVVQFIISPQTITGDALISLIEKMFDIVKKIVEALVSNGSVWLSFLFDTLLGPIGDIIKAVQSAVCSVLGFVNDLGANMDTSFCDSRRRLQTEYPPKFRRKLLSNSSVLFQVTNDFEWDDNSRCDRIIMAYKDYEIEKMIPLEKIEWLECLQLRMFSEILEENFQIGIPKDLFYNWMRKYIVVYDVIISSSIYLSWYMKDTSTIGELKITLNNYGYNPEHVLNTVKHLTSFYNEIFSWKHLKVSLEELWNVDGDNKGTRVYENVRKLHKHVLNTKWTASLLESKKALNKFHSKHMKLPSMNFTNYNLFSKSVNEMLQFQKDVDLETFGKSYYGAFTNLQCPEDSLLCLNCAFVDNFLYNALWQLQNASEFYSNDYRNVIIPEFKQYWENVSSYNARYTKAYSNTIKEKRDNIFGGTLEVTLTFSDFLTGLFNGTNTIEDLIQGVSYFLQGNYTGEIPSDAKIIFANDLQYYLEAPFTVGCDEAEWKWKSSKENVGDGLLSVLILFLSLEAFRIFIGDLNILITATMYTFAILFSQFLYMYNVYQYNPICYPILPSYLVYDFLHWLDINLFLECACSYVPYLSIEPCVQQTCDTCNITSTFHDCRDILPAFNELGYGYHFIFFIRWFFPDQYQYFGNLRTWPFPYIFSNTGINMLLVDVERNLDISGEEYNCFYLHILTPICIMLLLYIGILLCIPLLNIIISTVKESILILINTILILYYLSVASATTS